MSGATVEEMGEVHPCIFRRSDGAIPQVANARQMARWRSTVIPLTDAESEIDTIIDHRVSTKSYQSQQISSRILFVRW